MWLWMPWVRIPLLTPFFLFFLAAGAADTLPALGCSQVVRHGTLTPAFAGSSPATPAKHDPLAQLAEHLTFNQGVWSSNLQWVTICLLTNRTCGHGGMADAPDLGSGAFGRKSSSLFVRTVSFVLHPGFCGETCGSSSVVECHLAKVDVAGPNPVYRSTCGCSSMAELQPSKLVTWVRFPPPAPATRLSAI